MTESTTTTPDPGPASDAGGGTPQRRRSLAVGGGRGEDVHAPAVRSTDTDREDLPDREPAKESGGAEDGGYAPSSGGASYTSDIAMMRAEVDYTENTVIPHYELLISQAQLAGNGPKTIQALQAGLTAARDALGAARDAIAQVQATSEPVQAAYDDAGGEAAKSKTYFHGD